MLQPPRSRRSPPPSVTTPPLTAILRDAGPAGLLCRAAEPLPELTRVAIAIELPHGGDETIAHEAVALTGVVVGCEPVADGGDLEFEIALRLEGMAPAAGARLVALLEPALAGR